MTHSTIKIGPAEKPLADADSQWVHQTLRRVTEEQGSVLCVRVTIREQGMALSLATCACEVSGGGGREPNKAERQALDLWNKLKLSDPGCNPNNVWAFIEHLRHLL